MRIRKSLFILPVLAITMASAQNEAYNWYFGGNAGMSFATIPPTSLNGGALSTSEGCASISDGAGNLLFYTDGVTVWNQNHVPMANGTGLLGDASSSQSALIVRKPGQLNKFYIFTLGCCGNGTLHYSEVDMTLAAGLGSVTVLNTPVYTGPCSEKLTAAPHANCTDIWILTHDWGSDLFRANLVTLTGVSSGGTVSAVGTVHNQSAGFVGCMKASPDARKIGLARSNSPNTVELFDFDNATGIVSNSLVLSSSGIPYGIEFSPDATKFYAARYTGNALYQYDLCAGSNSAIAASEYTVPASGTFASMQLGPDGKIYIAQLGAPNIAVIHNPNLTGAAIGYSNSGIALSPNTSYYGLPNFFVAVRPPLPGPVISTVVCGTANFTAPVVSGSQTTTACSSLGYSITSTGWIFGDPASGSANVSSLSNPTHIYATAGTYTVKFYVNYSCLGGSDTVYHTVATNSTTALNVTGNHSICAGNSVTLTATGATTYSWNTGATSSVIIVSPGTTTNYVVYADKGQACSSFSIITVQASKCTDLSEEFIPKLGLRQEGNGNKIHLDSPPGTMVYIYSVTGALLTEIKTEDYSETLELSEFSDGIYIVRLDKGGYSKAYRLLILEPR
jgi:hypothetical protein